MIFRYFNLRACRELILTLFDTDSENKHFFC